MLDFILFLFLCVVFLLFSLFHFRLYTKYKDLSASFSSLQITCLSYKKQIDEVIETEKAIAFLRHDMRHFLTTLNTFIDSQELSKAKKYIQELITSVNHTCQNHFSSWSTINSILSFYNSLFQEYNIDFKYQMNLHEIPDISDVDITVILSNSLENAIHAVRSLPVEKRHIHLRMYTQNDHLLISLENSYSQKAQIINGIPISTRPNHGYGTRSILKTINKLKGQCLFSQNDDFFLLEIIL